MLRILRGLDTLGMRAFFFAGWPVPLYRAADRQISINRRATPSNTFTFVSAIVVGSVVYMSSDLRVLKKLSATALSQQLPFRPHRRSDHTLYHHWMSLEYVPKLMASVLYSSVRMEAAAARINGVNIGLFLIAIFQAGITVSHVFIVSLNDHPRGGRLLPCGRPRPQ